MHSSRCMASRRVDVVIVGGGPAGLSAALVLGRCRRDTVLFDDGNYRNAPARHMRGFLTRDRTSPRELRQLAHADVERYPSVTIIPETIADARQLDDGFSVITKAGTEYETSALLVATGFRDTQPTVAGARELHGDLIVPCPYCDAWEVRDQPLAAFSYPDERGARFAMLLAQWSGDVVFCAEKRPRLGDDVRRELANRGVRVEHRELRSVEREGEGLRLVFAEGESLWRRAIFYHLGGEPGSLLASRLGAACADNGGIETTRKGETNVPGLFVAGDASRDVLQAIVAAGEGAAAAVTINEYLCRKEPYAKPPT